MLRAMISDTAFEQKWVLQGKLCGRWAEDLHHQWESTRSTRRGRRCAVDLEDVTCVDRKGETVLLEMVTEGAVFAASRVYMKHVLETLSEHQS
jgi:ABC-type transporter Mla MlaB component